MARRATVDVPVGEDHDEVVGWYRERLAEPAVFPWAGSPWEPVRLGPTWQTTSDGRWVCRTRRSGGMCSAGAVRVAAWSWPSVRFTYLEHARFVLWWYALDARAGGCTTLHPQRLKGWGGPARACLIYTDCWARPVRWGGGGPSVATDNPMRGADPAVISSD